ncbi:unnamed protein product [Closterium sp. NIES-54]
MSVASGGGGSSGAKSNSGGGNGSGSNSTFSAARVASSSGNGGSSSSVASASRNSSSSSNSSSRRPLPSIYVPISSSHSSLLKPSPLTRKAPPSPVPSPSFFNPLRAFLAPFYRLSSARPHAKLTRSNIAEQLREYQRRRQHDWASAAFYAATAPSPPASAAARRRRCALAVLLVVLVFALCSSAYFSVQVWRGMRYGWAPRSADIMREAVYERTPREDRGGRTAEGETSSGNGEAGERGREGPMEGEEKGGERGDRADWDGEDEKGRLKAGPATVGDGRMLVLLQPALLLVAVAGVLSVAACSRQRWRKGRRRRSGSSSRLLPS